jgi:hypothetical protein
MTKAYNKKVKPQVFQEEDLILRKILAMPNKDQSKWAPNY